MDPGNDRSSIKITGDEFESVRDELAAYAWVKKFSNNDLMKIEYLFLFRNDDLMKFPNK